MTASRFRALAVVAVAYYLGGLLGLRLSMVVDNVTPLWPPTGIALTAFLLYGRSLWPAVALAAFLVNLRDVSAPTALVIAVGNTLGPYTASYVLERIGFRRQLNRLRDAIAIVTVGVFSMLISATVGASALALFTSEIPNGGVPATWAVWWTGDAMGVLVLTPFLLSIPLFWELDRWSGRQWAEAVAILVVVTGATLWAARNLNVLFLALPVVGWAAWRLQLRGAAASALIASTIVTWSATRAIGPFQAGSLLHHMLILLSFNASIVLTSSVLSALVTERNEATTALRLAAEDLGLRVSERTTELSELNERLRTEIRERSETQAQLSQEEARSQREHDIAASLQRGLLPEQLPDVPGVAVAARYVPATSDIQIGGDWYDVLQLPGGQVGLVIGDVAGHGIAAAASMAQMRMATRVLAMQDPSPASVLRGIQRLVNQLSQPDLVTVLYAVLDPSTRQLHYTSAGHPPALVVSDRGSTYLSAPPSPPVGVTTDGTYKVATQELPAGSALVLYTDGLVERRGVSLTDGLERLRSAADAVASDDVERLCDHLLASLIHRDHVADDIALVALRPLPLAGQPLHLDVPAEARFLARARANLRHWLRESGATPAEESDLLVAVGEACANVVQHAYPAAPGRLQIEARIEDGVLDVWVRDEGRWRAPADRGGGWGLKLMRALTDSVDVARNPHGTVVHLRRLLGIRVGSST